MVREYHTHTWEGNVVPVSVPEPKALSSVVGEAASSLSAYLGLHLRGKCCVAVSRRTVITRASELNWKRLPYPPTSTSTSTTPMSSTALGSNKDESSFLFSTLRSGSLSQRDGTGLEKPRVIEQAQIGYLVEEPEANCLPGPVWCLVESLDQRKLLEVLLSAGNWFKAPKSV